MCTTPKRFAGCRLSILLCMAVVAGGVVSVLTTMLNHDVGYYLLMARALTDGRDLHDTFAGDMPSNVWLPILSLRLSQVMGMLYADVHQVVLIAFVVACGILAGRPVSSLASRGSLVAVATTPWMLAILLLFPNYAFGQRDHLFVAGFAPLVTTVGARKFGFVSSPAFSVAVALAAMFAISQKPYFALPAVTLGVCEWLAQRRRLAAIPRELWLTGLLCTAFAIGTHLVYPQFFTRVLPSMSLWLGPLMQSSKGTLLATPAKLVPGCLLTLGTLTMAIVWYWVSGPSARREGASCIVVWFAVSASLLAMYVLQRHGLDYQILPFVLYALLSFGIASAVTLDRLWKVAWWKRGTGRARWLASPIGIGGVVVVGAVLAWFLFPSGTWKGSTLYVDIPRSRAIEDPLTHKLRALPAGSYVLALSTGVPPISPLHAYADVRWSGRFGALSELRAALDWKHASGGRTTPGEPLLEDLESVIRARIMASLRDRKPDLLIIDVSRPMRWFEDRPGFSLLRYLMQDPDFRNEMAGYRWEGTVRSVLATRVAIFRPTRGTE